MLIVQRKPGQSVLIGPDIEVHFLKKDGAGIRLGIDAPRNVLILRNELSPHYTNPDTGKKRVAEGNRDDGVGDSDTGGAL